MLNAILLVIILAQFTLCYYYYLSFSLHMLQLSSYHNPTHLLYEENNKRYIYAPYKIFLLIPCILAAFFGMKLVPSIISILILTWFCYIAKPLPAKKPFVVTWRIRRLYITGFVLYFLVMALLLVCMNCNRSLTFVLLSAFSLFIYPVTRLLNWLNAPIEKANNNRYLRDAQRILKAKSRMEVVGITGSFGKTSTKYFLQSILASHFESLMTPASFNTPMGVVRTIREHLKPTHTHFVVEMGARHKGEIEELCDIVHPDFGIVTSIGEQHLETFFNVETIIKTKLELYDAVHAKNGTTFFNIDSDLIRENLPTEGNIVTYGIEHKADYMAYDLSVSELGISFSVRTPQGEEHRFTTKLLGKHNVVNILGAIAVSHTLGIPLNEMTVAVATLTPVPHRLELKPSGENVIIDDAYNSNPTGAKAALDALDLCNGMKIVVTPGMVELGEREYELNKIFGTQIAEMADYVCLVGKKDHIYEGLMEKGYPEEKIFRTLDVREAINHALALENTSKGKKYILLENALPDNY